MVLSTLGNLGTLDIVKDAYNSPVLLLSIPANFEEEQKDENRCLVIAWCVKLGVKTRFHPPVRVELALPFDIEHSIGQPGTSLFYNQFLKWTNLKKV